MKLELKYDKDFFKDTSRFLEKGLDIKKLKSILEDIGDEGVDRLAEATPMDTGMTADSWTYEIEEYSDTELKLYFINENEVNGANVAMLLQYGHGTRNGGYVPGDDYINPVLDELGEELADAVAEEVDI